MTLILRHPDAHKCAAQAGELLAPALQHAYRTRVGGPTPFTVACAEARAEGRQCIVSPDANLSRISWAMLTVSYAVGAVTALTVPSASFAIRMRDLITLPFYWPLQFFAMARALYSLARRPHYWVKTPREGVPGAGGAHQF